MNVTLRTWPSWMLVAVAASVASFGAIPTVHAQGPAQHATATFAITASVPTDCSVVVDDLDTSASQPGQATAAVRLACTRGVHARVGVRFASEVGAGA